MGVFAIVPATDEHAVYLSRRLRAADRVEIGKSAPADILALLRESLKISRWANTGLLDGRVAVIYGVSPSLENPHWGVPWMLASDDAAHIRKEIVLHSRDEVVLMHAHFPFLYNQVHGKNVQCIQWLLWLDFVIDFEHPVQREQGEFLNFWRGNPHV